MSNDWTFNSNRFATWDALSPQGMKGLGFYQLIFPIEITTHPKPTEQSISVSNIYGRLNVRGLASSSNPTFLGRLLQYGAAYPISTYEHVGNQHISLEIELDGRRIEAIEQIRLGGNLTFSIDLYATAYQGATSLPLNQSAQLSVSQSDWIKLLENIGYRKTLLLEVPVPNGESNPALSDSTKHLANAQKQMLHGHYREAIGACRDALESVNLFLKNFEAPLSPDKRSRDKSGRFSAIRQSLFELTHAAKHADEVTSQIEWNLTDTRAAIGLTATLLQWVSEEYGG